MREKERGRDTTAMTDDEDNYDSLVRGIWPCFPSHFLSPRPIIINPLYFRFVIFSLSLATFCTWIEWKLTMVTPFQPGPCRRCPGQQLVDAFVPASQKCFETHNPNYGLFVQGRHSRPTFITWARIGGNEREWKGGCKKNPMNRREKRLKRRESSQLTNKNWHQILKIWNISQIKNKKNSFHLSN